MPAGPDIGEPGSRPCCGFCCTHPEGECPSHQLGWHPTCAASDAEDRRVTEAIDAGTWDA